MPKQNKNVRPLSSNNAPPAPTSNDKNRKDDKQKPKGKRSASTTKKVELPQQNIPINSAIETSNDCFFITSKLGSGGFGDVYEVIRRSDKRVFAVKVEYVKNSPDRRLKKEYELYREITAAKLKSKSNAQHLMEVIDYGEVTGQVHFMFMPLCGKSLDSIMEDSVPNLATAISLSEQSLRAIQNFHSFMHIHRDLKPANFVLGRPPEENTIYLIDFGMSVRFCTDPKRMPKTSVYDFIGTTRYASRTTHKGMPQTRKDDIEAWMYIAMEFFRPKILPWASEKNNDKVGESKESLFVEKPDEVFSAIPDVFLAVAESIDETSIFGEPNYDLFHGLLHGFAKNNNASMTNPFSFVKAKTGILPTWAKIPTKRVTPPGLTPPTPKARKKTSRKKRATVDTEDDAWSIESKVMSGEYTAEESNNQIRIVPPRLVSPSQYEFTKPGQSKESLPKKTSRGGSDENGRFLSVESTMMGSSKEPQSEYQADINKPTGKLNKKQDDSISLMPPFR